MNQLVKKDSGLLLGVAASAFLNPSLGEASLAERDLRPTPLVAPAERGNFDFEQIALPPEPGSQHGAPQRWAPQSIPLPGGQGIPQSPPEAAAIPVPPTQPLAEERAEPPLIGPPPPLSMQTTNGVEKPIASALTPADLAVIRETIREELQRGATPSASVNENEPIDSNLFWKGLTIITAFMAAQGYWRWRYRTQDDFRKKASDLRGMLHNESLYFEDSKFVVAYDRAPKTAGETRQLIIENPRTPRDLDTDLETIIGPYCSEHLRRAAMLCTPDDPFIMDHVTEVPISWAWIRDEFFRWEFGSAIRLWRAKQHDEQRFTADLIKLRLKTALESALGEQALDILEGRDRSPRHFLIAVLCDVRQSDKSPTGEMRRIAVRVISDDQFNLYGDPVIVARMQEFNRDTVVRDIELMTKLFEREHRNRSDNYANGAGLLPGHPRANRPTYDYSEAVRLILRPAEGTPADPAHIRAVYGGSN